jgi:hypothetical protein
MRNLSYGVDTDVEDEDEEEVVPMLRSSNIGEVTIAHTGKKFIVRKNARKQISELGRYNTLEEAMQNLPSREHIRSYLQAKRNRAEDDEDELWCTYCIDDPSIELCSFCGCKV